MKKIGSYEIRETLGKGAMGTVYKVLIPGIKKIAALKRLDPSPKLVEKMGIEWVRDQFVNEAAIIANIRHPHVVDVFGFEHEQGRMYYLMEFFCQNLGTNIRETYWADAPSRTVPVKRATELLTQILQGLSRLHQSGIVHRDIKPFNIMLTDGGDVKIADFGLSNKRGEASLLDKGFLDEKSCEDKILIGTKYYAAPEQVRSPDKADHRADLYSAGVLLYRMLTGTLPLENYRKPSLLNPDLGESWDRFLLKAMAPQPEARFSDAQAMADELQSVYDAYRMKRDKECEAPSELFDPPSLKNGPGQKPMHLRSIAGRVIARRAKSIFDIDELGRPNAYLRKNLTRSSAKIVIDHGTNLAWQQAGSPYPMNLKAAKEYIENLRETGFGGFRNWRIPTVNEIFSLINPPSPGENFCFEPLFSPTQNYLWSCDSRSFKASWIVNVDMGFVMSSDILDFYYAKGVCTL